MPKAVSKSPARPTVFALLRRYPVYTFLLVLFTILANGLGLLVPRIIATGMDTFSTLQQVPPFLLWQSGLVVAGVFVFAFAQSVMQSFTSEIIARDLRNELAAKISRQHNATVERFTPAVLLTNLTSDIDAIKAFVAQAVAGIVSSVLLIIGSSFLLLVTDWKLALVVLLIIPIIGFTFRLIFSKVQVLFVKGQEVVDWLNNVINESILGSGLIRILNSQDQEKTKFAEANTEATQTGLKILGYFASLIPIITFTASMAVLVVVVLGGYFVITGEMTLGNFTAFNSYIGILIFPIIMIGVMGNIIARSTASYGRIQEVLLNPDPATEGTLSAENLKGNIAVNKVTLTLGKKEILKEISFKISAGTRTALIGPTAAGKTQLLSLLVGLTQPTSGSITYDSKKIAEYNPASLFRQIGVVFQESVIFSMSLRENISFGQEINDTDVQRAIETAELSDLIDSLPQGLDTLVAERGTNLSGGQKQRLMLARALALNPTVLVLDDFTARVDLRTERKIVTNIERNYPHLTLISITQKISSVKDYDQILVVMEGEVIAKGTHAQLLKKSPEYIQMYESQKSTSHYEVPVK